MKKFLKKYFKFIVGIFALLIVVFIFVIIPRKSASLETSTLKDWRSESIERRMATVQVLTASDDNLEKIVACVDKMATLPDSSDMMVRDATQFCSLGYKLKENI